jgi:phosphate transport system substrate-binding protein
MTTTKNILFAICVFAALVAAGCSSSETQEGAGTTTSAAGDASAGVLVGAGSTFVYPLVTEWIKDYAEAGRGTITYGPIGSGGGIESISSGVVDFGASDAPLTPDQKAKCSGCVQIPWALAGTSIPYNVPGAPSHLKLTGDVLARIYLGTITRWDDPAIAKLNPGASLPGLEITPLHRSDSSGTTFNFTDYLSQVSPRWKTKVGAGTQVSWSIGPGAKGSSGLAGLLSRTEGAIGYVDVAYSLQSGFAYAAIRNRAGKFVLPDNANVAAAAATVKTVPPDNAISIVDPPASSASAYPISTFTYAIVHTQSPKSQQLKQFLTYAIGPGQKFGAKLEFAKLPAAVLAADWKTIAKLS